MIRRLTGCKRRLAAVGCKTTEDDLEMRQIGVAELRVGETLPWDVYGDGGSLLAKKGYALTSERQIESLVQRGLVVQEIKVREAEETPSVLRMLNGASQRLQIVLDEIAHGRASNARTRLQDIARAIAAAIDLQSDVALACILHNQAAGPYCVRHSVDTAIVALLVARALKKTPADMMTVTLAALTMNVGMFDHQERMQASMAPLSAQDTALIHAHPEAGVAKLKLAGITDEDWLACVLLHHETENGSGYPHGKKAEDIPDAARIVSLADRYCARVSARNYRKSMVPNAALRDILLEGKTTTDAQLAAVFIRELGIYPIGTFVRLLNGEIGVVTRKGANTTTPIVDALVGPRGAPLEVIIRRDTQNDRHSIREVLNEAQAAIGFRLDQLWGRVASA
jgi:HD-GYP domain-containing protein (c-di-GMP phosphodiesterase class II)